MTLLPDPLPRDPLPLAAQWLADAEAEGAAPNWNSMALATVSPDQAPAVRVVLCKELLADPGYIVFYTNYGSDKARDLDYQPRAAGVFHWDTLGRQLRIEGIAVKSPAAESDRYFATRDLESQLGAWASDQSRAVNSRAELLTKLEQTAERFGARRAGSHTPESAFQVPRPPGWGGYRLWIDSVEFWLGCEGRIHDRARWQRHLEVVGTGHETASDWQVTRLQP